jgi:hypothetical protein
MVRVQIAELGYKVSQHLYEAARQFGKLHNPIHSDMCALLVKHARAELDLVTRYLELDMDGTVAAWVKTLTRIRDSCAHGCVAEGWLSPQLGAQALRDLAKEFTGGEGQEDAVMVRLTRASEALKKAPCLNLRQGDGDTDDGRRPREGARRYVGRQRSFADGSTAYNQRQELRYTSDAQHRSGGRYNATSYSRADRDATGRRDHTGSDDRGNRDRPSPQAAAARSAPSAPNANAAGRGGELV